MNQKVIPLKDEALILKYPSTQRGPEVYDFNEFPGNPRIKSEAKRAFESFTATYERTSRKKAFPEFSRFIRFTLNRRNGRRGMVDPFLLVDYAESLDSDTALKNNRRIQYFLTARRAVLWYQANSNDHAWLNVLIIQSQWTLEGGNPKATVSAEGLEAILRACKKEMSSTFERIEAGRKSLTRRGRNRHGDVEKLIRRAVQLGRGIPPHAKECADLGVSIRESKAMAPFAFRTLFPDADDYASFYIFLLVSCIANADGMHYLSRRCILSATSNTESIIVWDKKRGSVEQSAIFDNREEWSPPRILRRLLALNAPMARRACEGSEDGVFLIFNSHSWPNSRVIGTQALLDAVDRFIQRNGLARFLPRDLRPSVASFIYDETGGNMTAVKTALQHTQLEKHTVRYVQRVATEQAQITVLGYQGKLLELASKRAAANRAMKKRYDTALGFDCSDSKAGVAEGSRKNEDCLQFLQCGFCENSVIVIDSVDSVARVIRARDDIKGLRQEARVSLKRYNEVYAPLLVIIERDILPKVSALIIEQASAAALLVPKFPLE